MGDEPFAPYQRPPLSKTYLAGTFERDRLFLKPDAFYTEAKCTTIFGVAAMAIDRAAKQVTLADGRTLSYDKLLLATGSRVRLIRVPGVDLPGIHYLRSIADVDGLRPAFKTCKQLAVIGGGYIGLEVAAVARKYGLAVTVFEALDRVMARAVSNTISDFYEKTHREAGVVFHLNTGVEGFEGKSRLEAVLAGGKTWSADVALVGIGIMPNDDLAKASGLTAGDGIHVNEFCQTSDPDIFAAGDCTRHHGRDGEHIRMECVQNAIDQAKHAALAWWASPLPIARCPGSGPTSTTSSSRSPASFMRATRRWSAATRHRANSRSFT